MTVSINESCADNQPKYRPAMVTTAGTSRSPMLRKSCPEFGARSGFEGMRSDPHYALAISGIGSVLARLLEKIHSASRPIHTTRAIR